MKVNIIKQLAETQNLESINKAITELENEQPLSIEVGGDDLGEQYTHLIAAQWILEEVKKNGSQIKDELRNYIARVRGSIS